MQRIKIGNYKIKKIVNNYKIEIILKKSNIKE